MIVDTFGNTNLQGSPVPQGGAPGTPVKAPTPPASAPVSVPLGGGYGQLGSQQAPPGTPTSPATPLYAPSGGGGPSAPAGASAPAAPTAPVAPTSTQAGALGPTSATTVNGPSNGGYNTNAIYTATDANGAAFTYQVDANGNIINKQYSRTPTGAGAGDFTFATALGNLAPSANPNEDDFFDKLSKQLQPLFDSINGAEAAAETAANVNASKATSAANFANNAQGMAGSSEADATARAISDSRAAAIADAKQKQAAALSTAYQFLTSEAYTQYKDALTRNDTLSAEYVANMRTQAQTVIASLFSQGVSPSDLMQTNPLEYQTLLQYFNGDTNAMNASFVSAAQKSLLNNGQPVFSSSGQVVYGQMTTNPDGTPGVKYTTIKLPQDLPQNYKISSFNQAANGQIAYIATPVDANGNAILDPNKENNGIITGFFGSTVNSGSLTGTTPNPTSTAITGATGLSAVEFNYLTQGTTALARMPNNQRLQVQDAVTKWLNDKGIDLATFQSQYKALNDTLANNVSRFNNTEIAEGEVNGTLANLAGTISDATLSSFKPSAIADLFAKGQTNDPTVAKYSFYLNDLRNSLAYFYAAQQGKTSPDVLDNEDAANVITNGIGAGTVSGLQQAVDSTTAKMKGVVQTAKDSAARQVWDLFGVGSSYQPQGSSSNTGGSSGGGSSTMYPAGSTVQDIQGNKYTVGADGVTLTPIK